MASKRAGEDSVERMQRNSTTAKANASKRAQQSEADKGKTNGKNAKCTANKRAQQSDADKSMMNEKIQSVLPTRGLTNQMTRKVR